MNQIVTVPLQDRAYDIHIGRNILKNIGHHAAALKARAAIIVTDTHVGPLYQAIVEASLEQAGLRVASLVLPAGEATKSYARFEEVCDAIIAAKIERGDLVIALGGGVIGDLTGFAAASVRRGIRFIQVPTSLLAQVDSSVGGKTGINSRHGKNLVGAFHQPSLVLADTGVLDTLSPREMRAGYAEIVKYGLINDADFFSWCEKNAEGIFAGGPEREEAVAASCRSKAAIVLRDEREEGERALLNLGHTFGHALERVTNYESARLVHGEAVAIGMCLAFRLSVQLNLCSDIDFQRMRAHIRSTGLPVHLKDVPGGYTGVDALLEGMAQDKKVKAGALTFILAKGIGQSFIAHDIAITDVRTCLENEIST